MKLFNDFKRFLAIPLVVSIIFFTCGSCSSDDQPTFNLVGTWAGTLIDEGIPINAELVFNSDSTGANSFQFEMFDQLFEETEIFSWTSTDTQFTLTYDSGQQVDIFDYSAIDQDTIIVEYIESEDGEEELITITMYRK